MRDAGIKVCCGGIVGMGESRRQRAGLIAQLANLDPYPESVPINNLVQVEGTPLHGTDAARSARIRAHDRGRAHHDADGAMVRLSAGREQMGEAVQALCFLAGANSIFYGDKLLTTSNPQAEADRKLLDRLGIRAEASQQMEERQRCDAKCGHAQTLTRRASEEKARFHDAGFFTLIDQQRHFLSTMT